MKHTLLALVIGSIHAISACAPAEEGPETRVAATPPEALALQGPDDVLFRVTGLSGPEAVRYDPRADVYFISNFNGDGDVRDGNGFITRAGPDGELLDARFMVGSEAHPLHAPRGMNLEGGVLWVADIDGVHGFDPATGEGVAYHDFTAFEPGFLNDIGLDGSGDLYVTDTGRSRVYRVSDGVVSVAVEDPRLGPPNGITWDAAQDHFVLAPWGGATEIPTWAPEATADPIGSAGRIEAGFFDGIEPFGAGFLVASQADSTLYFLDDSSAVPWIRVVGNPADIAIDTRRSRVAVPYISENRVDIWALPDRP